MDNNVHLPFDVAARLRAAHRANAPAGVPFAAIPIISSTDKLGMQAQTQTQTPTIVLQTAAK